MKARKLHVYFAIQHEFPMPHLFFWIYINCENLKQSCVFNANIFGKKKNLGSTWYLSVM